MEKFEIRSVVNTRYSLTLPSKQEFAFVHLLLLLLLTTTLRISNFSIGNQHTPWSTCYTIYFTRKLSQHTSEVLP